MDNPYESPRKTHESARIRPRAWRLNGKEQILPWFGIVVGLGFVLLSTIPALNLMHAWRSVRARGPIQVLPNWLGLSFELLILLFVGGLFVGMSLVLLCVYLGIEYHILLI